MDERQEFVEWITGRNDPDYEYHRLKRIVDSDTRLNKTKYSDIKAEAEDVIKFQKSQVFKQTEKAKNLLPSNTEVNSEDLKQSMQQYYAVSDQDYDNILSNLANSKDINVHVGPFDRKVKISKLK